MARNKRWLTARHEAGHAVAALHYGCPIAHVTIERDGYKLGTTRLRVQFLEDAIVLLCGPLAENDWDDLLPGTPVQITTVGADQEGMVYLAAEYGDLQPCVKEACLFISQPAVQEQIDRVARLLLERERLTDDEVREAAGFTGPLCSSGWRGID